MAATVSSITLTPQDNRYVAVHRTNIYVDTAETAAVLVDKSTLTLNGAEPGRLVVEKIDYNIQGYTYIKLFFDHDTDITVALLSGKGTLDLAGLGGLTDTGTGGTGDICIATVGTTATNTYDITIVARKES